MTTKLYKQHREHCACNKTMAAYSTRLERDNEKLRKALEGRCWHRDLYDERDDGVSDIYPDIMHEGSCLDESATCTHSGLCSACEALKGAQ